MEPTARGPSTQWAIRTATRLDITVAVGYPELCTSLPPQDGSGIAHFDKKDTEHGHDPDKSRARDGRLAYNSLVFVDAKGIVVAHYRKHHLYYTDEPWAEEGPEQFLTGQIPLGSVSKHQKINMLAGVCMDLNPKKFLAPWTAFEFSTQAVQSQAKLVVVSMAWLTRLTRLELELEAGEPDLDTFSYWLERFRPLLSSQPTGDFQDGLRHTYPADDSDEVIVVLANRTGDEGLGRIIGEVRYAGSSCVVGLKRTGEVRLYNILGRATQGLCIADTRDRPKYTLEVSPATSTQG